MMDGWIMVMVEKVPKHCYYFTFWSLFDPLMIDIVTFCENSSQSGSLRRRFQTNPPRQFQFKFGWAIMIRFSMLWIFLNHNFGINFFLLVLMEKIINIRKFFSKFFLLSFVINLSLNKYYYLIQCSAFLFKFK
jgi:hypothetical protein